MQWLCSWPSGLTPPSQWTFIIVAPEVIELKGASPASDIWSLGCTIIEMLTGRPPYADLLAMTTLFRIVEDERPPLPNDLSADLLDFLCQCFQKDPVMRPSASALGRHAWIKRNFVSKVRVCRL